MLTPGGYRTGTWSANKWPSGRPNQRAPVHCSRRKSVFAEHYDPEKDDDEGEVKVIHPKTDEQRRCLAEAVQNIFLFRSLDYEQSMEVLDAMFERKVATGEYVIRQGDDGDNFYVINCGIYEVFVSREGEEKHVGTYHHQGSFGELALMYNVPRAASVRAAIDGSLWAMDRQTFRRILLKGAFKKRKIYESLLENVPMLRTLESYERMNLADAFIPKIYEDGQQIIRQGDQADGMYFVENGRVRITVHSQDDDKECEVSQIANGGYFGELALVTHKPRAASAYAVGKTRLAFLDVQAFERLLGPCLEVMQRSIDDYEEQLVKIFGSKANLSDVR
ncbi:cAMP-dependent protein kinase type II regulatory subunit [Chamberlinius hualienensis]